MQKDLTDQDNELYRLASEFVDAVRATQDAKSRRDYELALDRSRFFMEQMSRALEAHTARMRKESIDA